MSVDVNPPGLFQPWLLEPVVTALAAVAALCFARGFVRLRRRGRKDHAPWTRAVLFALGLALMVLPVVSPLDELADRYLLSAHMLQHMLIGDAGPALIIVALRGPLLLFVIPTALLTTLGHSDAPATCGALAAPARSSPSRSGRSPSVPGTSPPPTTTPPPTSSSTT